MAKSIHKGTELNNVSETWDENERRRNAGNAPDTENVGSDASTGSDLEQIIKEEAAEYDNESKENRILSGERATLNDDEGTNDDE